MQTKTQRKCKSGATDFSTNFETETYGVFAAGILKISVPDRRKNNSPPELSALFGLFGNMLLHPSLHGLPTADARRTPVLPWHAHLPLVNVSLPFQLPSHPARHQPRLWRWIEIWSASTPRRDKSTNSFLCFLLLFNNETIPAYVLPAGVS